MEHEAIKKGKGGVKKRSLVPKNERVVKILLDLYLLLHCIQFCCDENKM